MNTPCHLRTERQPPNEDTHEDMGSLARPSSFILVTSLTFVPRNEHVAPLNQPINPLATGTSCQRIILSRQSRREGPLVSLVGVSYCNPSVDYGVRERLGIHALLSL